MEHKDEKLNQLVDRLMAHDALDRPSQDFTDKVMDRLQAETSKKTFVYKPLISKPVWAILGLVVLAIVAYIYIYEPNSNSGWLESMDLSFLQINSIEGITLDFSRITMYAIVLFAVMISIQIPVLKNYFNKRMAV